MRRLAMVLITTLLALALQADRAEAQPGNPAPGQVGAVSFFRQEVALELVSRADRNNDHKLSGDEFPLPRDYFPTIDADHDGYVDGGELARYLNSDPARAVTRGPVIANCVYTVADDFVVEVYHNGERVPDAKRSLQLEIHGASIEKVDIEVRRGDWLVFNVVNNRFRWDGASYFAAAGMMEEPGKEPRRGFTTEVTTGSWSACDDIAAVPGFIADPLSDAARLANVIEKQWDLGKAHMDRIAGNWMGSAIWGSSRNTWIKYRAR